MPDQLPTSPAFQSVNIKNNQPNLVTISTSGRKQVKTQQAQFFSFTASYPPLTRAQFGPIAAHIMKQKGAVTDFEVIIPEYSTTNGALTTQAVTLTNTESVGATVIELTAGSLTLAGALKAGDFVRFQGFTKVHMVTADVDFSSGSATMNILPGLFNSVSSGQTIDYKDVKFTVFLENPVQEFQTGLAGLVRYELDMREAI
jgi:hypothetical protein